MDDYGNDTINSLTDCINIFLNNSRILTETEDPRILMYRGQADTGYNLSPSIFRNNGLIKEARMIRELKRLTPAEFVHNESALDQLIKMQHYGLPTRLLDITSNPLVALYFACADEADKTSAYKQLKCFREFLETVETKNGIQIPIHHCSNSAGIMDLKNDALNIARIGIAMYGIFPSDDMQNQMELKPALSLRSHIVYIKTLPKGCPISYGGTFITKEETKVATIPVGYGDGYPRGLSNCGYVLIHGKAAPILGRVCMDQFMVDVTNIPEAKEGDMVTLIGKNGDKEITVESLCSLYGGFRYEMICDIGKRVPKEYYADGKMIYSKDYHDDLK